MGRRSTDIANSPSGRFLFWLMTFEYNRYHVNTSVILWNRSTNLLFQTLIESRLSIPLSHSVIVCCYNLICKRIDTDDSPNTCAIVDHLPCSLNTLRLMIHYYTQRLDHCDCCDWQGRLIKTVYLPNARWYSYYDVSINQSGFPTNLSTSGRHIVKLYRNNNKQISPVFVANTYL